MYRRRLSKKRHYTALKKLDRSVERKLTLMGTFFFLSFSFILSLLFFLTLSSLFLSLSFSFLLSVFLSLSLLFFLILSSLSLSYSFLFFLLCFSFSFLLSISLNVVEPMSYRTQRSLSVCLAMNIYAR